MKKLFLLLLIFSGCTSPIKKDVFTRKSLNYNDLMEINRSLSLELLHSFDTLSPKEFEMIYNTKQYADVDYLCGSLRKDSIFVITSYSIHYTKLYDGKLSLFVTNDGVLNWDYVFIGQSIVYANKWQYVAVIRSGVSFYFYINGLLDSIHTVSPGYRINDSLARLLYYPNASYLV